VKSQVNGRTGLGQSFRPKNRDAAEVQRVAETMKEAVPGISHIERDDVRGEFM